MSLSGLIEQHALARPEATAVTYPAPAAGGGNLSLSYGELNRAAHRLAARLTAQGVAPGDRVVTALPTGPDLVTALLAILRTGAAYVTLDPAHPADRRRLILRDSSARAVVTAEDLAADYTDLGATVITVDADAEADTYADATDLTTAAGCPAYGAEEAAYVHYSFDESGSPIGAVVPHRALLALVRSAGPARLTSDDVVAQAAGPASDALAFEVWSSLAVGARLAGLPLETVTDPASLERAVAEQGMTVLFLPTTRFHRTARERPAAFAPLRTLMFGGEPCDPALVREVFRAGPPSRLLQVYGRPETAGPALWQEVREPAEDARTVPVGRPLGDTFAVVVGADGTPAGPDGTGELLLGGPVLATGHLGRPAAAAQRFVEDRFTGSGGPLLRTGDLVRLREDGELELTGRLDRRIRLSGADVDLGEIESALAGHPAVAEAAVTADGSRLVAHVVPAARVTVTADPTGPSDPTGLSDSAGPSDSADSACRTAERIGAWKEIHDTLYDDAAAIPLGHNFAGWTSSYDGQPIPLDRLRDWRSATVRRVRELGQRRILEIGAGTGLLLAPLAAAPECEEYWATDFSASVIDALHEQTRKDPALRDTVRLSCREAHDTAGLPARHFDTVIINSVVQYFPGPAYLRTVVERALELLAPGGSILLGDLRHLGLARCLRTGIELARTGPDPEAAEVRGAVARRAAAETELLTAPELFTALARELPAIRSVDVRIKRGSGDDELTRYRYDVVLGTAEPAADLARAPRLDWGRDLAGLPGLAARLREERPALLRVAGIPNGRVYGEYAAMLALDGGGQGGAATPAEDPEELCAAAEAAGYRALPTWSAAGHEAFDLVLVDPDRVPAGPLTSVYEPAYQAAGAAAGDLANDPAAFEETVGLDVLLRRHLRERLPDHPVPAALTVLDALPLDSGGRIDRTALTKPATEPVARPAAEPAAGTATEPAAGIVAGIVAGRAGAQPGTPVQEIVRDLFAEVLGLPRRAVDADADFFGLGGHALSAARLLARVRETLGADPGSRAVYEAPTPALFAALLGDGPAAATGPGRATGQSAVLPLRLRGPLQTRALEAALEDLGRRHEALRNSRLGAAGTRLRGLAADDHLLELTLPGDTVDLWSHAPLAADLALAYGARVAGSAPVWAGGVPQGAPRAMWGDLEPTPAPGAEPASAPGSSGPFGTYDGRAGFGAYDGYDGYGAFGSAGYEADSFGSLDLDLDAGLHTALSRLAAEHGATLFMVVHAALAALLTRLGSGPGITLAAPVPARDDAALRGAVGAYGRVLALSVDTSGDPVFAELLRRVREADLAAYRNGDAALALPGGIALSVLQEADRVFEAAGLSVRAETPQLPQPMASLALTLTERHSASGAPAGISVGAAFQYEGIGEAAAASLTGQLLSVLEAAAEAPHLALSRLRLLPGEAEVCTAETGSSLWSGEPVVLPPARSAAGMFAAQVARTPDAPALGGMDYAELDARSDLLAHVLIGHRAGPGSAVATAIASPTGFAVAALAIAKAGAACLPVDPAAGLSGAARPAVLLLDEAADRLLGPVPGVVRLVRDAAADLLPAGSSWPVRPADRTRPLDPAGPVVLATAGPAGSPGSSPRASVATVAIGGEPLAAASLGGAADAAWLVHGYPDAEAALGLLGALVSGGRVHLPEPSLAYGRPHEVLGWLRERGASVVLGHADEVLVALARARHVPLTVSVGRPEGRLLVEQTPDGRTRPVPGYRALVLDAAMRPVAAGAVGALYIAGVGVAQGYPGLPAATGERFLPDPLAGPRGTARMWRTGHAARVTEDGSLHVLEDPWADDPFADEFGTFVVVADGTGHRALWPAGVPVPGGWQQTHAEDVYELCLDHIDEQLNDHL
ncbi:AMP-binding protein [Streptomyces sp. NPDC051211]|uniref:AMP-binding protein n=1 Tax=Streptomyces sp. NPDC051211 TaxID=3154643 RepID=UPI00344FF8C5